MISQEEQRTCDSDEYYVKGLNARFDEALWEENEGNDQKYREIQEADRRFRQIDLEGDWEDHPEQPYLASRFEYMDQICLYPDFSMVPPYDNEYDEGSAGDPSYVDERVHVGDQSSHSSLLGSQHGDNLGFSAFFEAAEDEDLHV